MLHVLKADGTLEPFDEEKLIHSINRAGVPKDHQKDVLQHVKSKLYGNIPTSEIYSYVVDHLGHLQNHPYLSARYSLKQAIMALGPTGYPFEDFVAKILEAQGFRTQVRQVLRGTCVSHEIDVLAEKDGKKTLIEAKFHNNPGVRSEVHVALYTKSRFDDVKEKFDIDRAWIVTNTKATTDAIAYAECMGMKIISWSYPEQGSLRDLIERSGLHPITLLTTINNTQKQYLLENHIVMCKDLRDHSTVFEMLNLSGEEKKKTLEEVDYICKTEQSSQSKIS